MPTYATINDTLTAPGSNAPLAAKVIAQPMTASEGLSLDDRLTLGPEVAVTTEDGIFELNIPIVEGVLWRFTVQPTTASPHGHWVMGVYEVTEDSALRDMVPTNPLNVTASLAETVFDARDDAQEAAAAAQAIGTTNDTLIAGRINDDASATRAAADSVYERRVSFNVERYGAVPGADCTATINAAVTAAESYGKRAVIEFGQGVYKYNGSWSLSGKSFSIKGVPGGVVGSNTRGTVIRAVSQTGPVIDFSGYQWPAEYIGRVTFEGFIVEGDGTSGATKKGIANSGASDFIIGAAFRDITVRNTGGAGVSLHRAYLNEFTNVLVETPVDPQGDAVPYFELKGCNGNRWEGCGVRSVRSSNDCWSGGAWRITDNGTYPSEQDRFNSCWAEFLHVPTNGTLFHMGANRAIVDGWQSWDCVNEAGATSTSHIRLVDSGVSNYGGNEIRGLVRGAETGTPSVGIDVQQSNNFIQGVKGFNGSNVKLASGVGYTTAILAGRVASATNAAFVDNSGQSTNVLIDNTSAIETHQNYRTRPKTVGQGGAGVQVEDPLTPANGAIWLGDQGARLQSISKNAYLTADAIFFRNTALASVGFYLGGSADPRVTTGSGTPEGVVTAAVGSIYFRKDGGAATSLYVKESGTGNTGWVAK